jgi:hypothetical protein
MGVPDCCSRGLSGGELAWFVAEVVAVASTSCGPCAASCGPRIANRRSQWPGKAGGDVAGRRGRGSRAELQDGCSTRSCETATVGRVHVVLLVAAERAERMRARAAVHLTAAGAELRRILDRT